MNAPTVNQQVKVIADLVEALEWAVNEFDGNTRYTSAQQLQNCIEKCREVLDRATGAA